MTEDSTSYEAAKKKVALAEIPLGKIAFRGPDRHLFLNGLLTNDIKNLPQGQGLLACLLTPKGKLIAHLFLYHQGTQHLALQVPQVTSSIMTTLSKSIVLTQTTMEDITSLWKSLYVVGPLTQNFLDNALSPFPVLALYGCAQITWQGEPILLFSYPLYHPEGILLLSSPLLFQKIKSHLLGTGKTEIPWLDSSALETLRVEAGVVLQDVDTDPETFPLEVGLEGAISFSKGCYMGQETMSRIKNLGHVNRHLVGLKMKNPVSVGSIVLWEKEPVGKITSLVYSPHLQANLGLAMIPTHRSSPGTRLKVFSSNREETVEVVSLPLL
ncbi:MAG: hypothetical protein HY399_01230 [Elusimicrobia bacterium]|nr:hypothetical protein [Elusimicrobiota bacterium]